MELYQTHYKKAVDYFRSADHLTYVTLHVVKDIKLVSTILDNIYLSIINGMDTILEYERFYKRILPLTDNFNSRLDVFRQRVVGRYGFASQDIIFIVELKELVDERKAASMEFTKSGKFVICSQDYRIRTVSVEEIKKYLSTTRNFLIRVNKAIK